MNITAAENGLSQEISPTTLVTGDPPPSFNEICKLKFGDYVQTALGRTRNDQTARTIGAIALYPSGNTSGGWYFMSLLTGQVVHRYSWTKNRNGEDIQLPELEGNNPDNSLVRVDINDEDGEALAELEEREDEM